MSDEKTKSASPTGGGEYEVGYGKPPKHTRFKPGQSGNPKGRPKGAKNLKTELLEELNEKIDIREGGRTRRVSKQRALLKAQMNRGIQGNARSAQIIVTMAARLLDADEHDADADTGLTEDEVDILAAYVDRERGRLAQQEANDETAQGLETTSAEPTPSDPDGAPTQNNEEGLP